MLCTKLCAEPPSVGADEVLGASDSGVYLSAVGFSGRSKSGPEVQPARNAAAAATAIGCRQRVIRFSLLTDSLG